MANEINLSCFTLYEAHYKFFHFIDFVGSFCPSECYVSCGSPGPEAVSIVQTPTYPISDANLEALVRDAVAKAGGLSSIISPGDVVVVKPNLVQTMWTSGSGVVTDKRVVRTVVKMAQEAGAGQVIIAEGTANYRDGEGSDRYCTRKAFKDAGFDSNGDMIDDATGAQLYDLNITGGLDVADPNYVTLVTLQDGLLQRSFYVPNILLNCDVLISVPVLKNHSLGTITGAMKKRVGCAPNDLYHMPGYNCYKHGLVHNSAYWDEKETVNRAVVDLNRVRPADFCVTDGLIGITNGPVGTNKPTPYVRCILAGRDAAAVDTIHSLIIGYEPMSVRHLQLSRQIGFGQTYSSLITVVGKSVQEVRNLFPEGYGGATRVELTPPVIGGITPAEGSIVSGVVTVSLSGVSDNIGVVKAELYVDGSLYAVDTSAPYEFSWNTSGYSTGPHTLLAKVYDAALNEASITRNLNVESTYGAISGRVRDSSGAAISDVTITTSPGSYTTTSGSDGIYMLSNVPPATYSVTASKTGYSSQTKTGIAVTAGQITTCDFSLQPLFEGLLNGNFESGFYQTPDVDHEVGNYWTRFVLAGAPKYVGWYGICHSPMWSQSFYEGSWIAGLYQRCSNATVGWKYTARVWVAGFTSSGGQQGSTDLVFWIGIDPKGGTDAASPNVIWSPACVPGDVWTQISVQATATASTVTVFLKAHNTSQNNMHAAFDDASISEDGPAGGIISGTVKNIVGNPIVGAAVSTSPGGYSAQTASDGTYIIYGVPVGTYSVSVSKAGYTPQIVADVSVTVGGTTTANFILSDPSPPSNPIVVDDGDYTYELTKLHASWSSDDPQTGIAEYQYSILTSSGVRVVDWTSVGNATSVTKLLTLTPSEMYYFEVKAKNGQGLWSEIGVSDGIIAQVPPSGIPAAKAAVDGSSVSVAGIVIAKFPVGGSQARIYIEATDRSCGIAVATTHTVNLGEQVYITGVMTTSDGERVVNANLVTVNSAMSLPTPLLMKNSCLGGTSFGLQEGVVDDAITGVFANGLNKVGLLVGAYGKVTFIDSVGAYFYIDDGSGLKDGSGNVGVRVACSNLPLPNLGEYVVIKGISSVTVVQGNVVRLLRPRSIADLSYATRVNLLQNPGFETGNLQYWGTFGSLDGVKSGPWFANINAHSGTWFIGNAADGGTKTGGVYQRVAFPRGVWCYAKGWSAIYRGDNGVEACQNFVGIDPTGGINPYAPTVQWSQPDVQPTRWYWAWREVTSPTVVCTGDYVTVFLDMRQTDPTSWHISCFDDAALYLASP